jgi:hypothetical protein
MSITYQNGPKRVYLQPRAIASLCAILKEWFVKKILFDYQKLLKGKKNPEAL